MDDAFGDQMADETMQSGEEPIAPEAADLHGYQTHQRARDRSTAELDTSVLPVPYSQVDAVDHAGMQPSNTAAKYYMQ
jgi:hypothetical protein